MAVEQDSEPLRTCAYSGVKRPESQMVRIGAHYVALEFKDQAVQYLQQGNEFETRKELESPPLKFWPIIRRTWELCRRHLWLLIGIRLTVTLPLRLVGSYLIFHHVEWGRLQQILFAITSLTVDSCGAAAIIAALGASWNGQTPNYLAAWLAAAHRGWAVLGASLISILLNIGGFVLCVVPGLIAAVRFSFSLCFVMDDKQGGMQSLRSSSLLSYGHFWRLLATYFTVGLATMVPVSICATMLTHLPVRFHTWEFHGCALAICWMPVTFLTVFIFVTYKALSTWFEKLKPVREDMRGAAGTHAHSPVEEQM